MLIVEQNTTHVNWHIGDPVRPLEYAGDVVISIDPSKTNMALLLGTPDGTILNTLEFSGNNRTRGPVQDTTTYCEEFRSFLRSYLEKANLYMVGVEQAITKQGTGYHHSNMVLTEIRGNVLNFFMETYGLRVLEINNWSWKSAILPKGYRSQYEKGSKKYFLDYFPDSPYSKYYAADMTDCICIYWYMIQKHCQSYALQCNRSEPSLTGYNYTLLPADSMATQNLKEVTFNPRFTLEDNLAFYSNRILSSFCMTVEVDKLSIPDVYGRCMLFSKDNLHDTNIKVVAVRK